MQKRLTSNENGFTLTELLVVIALIGLLIGGSILALNSARPRAKARNLERETEINTILAAVYQYATDNDGSLPSTITATDTEICKTGAAGCTGLIDLSVLTASSEYLVELPTDPQVDESANGIGYNIFETTNGRVTVHAPLAEDGETISVTK